MKQVSTEQSARVEDLLRRSAQAVQIPDHDSTVITMSSARPSAGHQRLHILASAAAVTLIAGTILAGISFHGQDTPPSTAPGAAARSHAASPGISLSQQIIDERIHEVSARIQQIAVSADPQFDLISSDRDPSGDLTGGLTVYRADDDPERLVKTYEPAIMPGVSVTYKTSLLSAKEAAELSRLVAAKQDELAEAGVMVSSWGGEVTPGGAFMINYDPSGRAPTAAQISQFEVYGKGTVTATTGVSVNLIASANPRLTP